ncbi:g2109 [Coccomyxa elongata]
MEASVEVSEGNPPLQLLIKNKTSSAGRFVTHLVHQATELAKFESSTSSTPQQGKDNERGVAFASLAMAEEAQKQQGGASVAHTPLEKKPASGAGRGFAASNQ